MIMLDGMLATLGNWHRGLVPAQGGRLCCTICVVVYTEWQGLSMVSDQVCVCV